MGQRNPTHQGRPQGNYSETTVVIFIRGICVQRVGEGESFHELGSHVPSGLLKPGRRRSRRRKQGGGGWGGRGLAFGSPTIIDPVNWAALLLGREHPPGAQHPRHRSKGQGTQRLPYCLPSLAPSFALNPTEWVSPRGVRHLVSLTETCAQMQNGALLDPPPIVELRLRRIYSFFLSWGLGCKPPRSPQSTLSTFPHANRRYICTASMVIASESASDSPSKRWRHTEDGGGGSRESFTSSHRKWPHDMMKCNTFVCNAPKQCGYTCRWACSLA